MEMNKLFDLIGSILTFNFKLFLILAALVCAFGPWAAVGYVLWLWVQ